MSTTVENFIGSTTPAHKRSALHQHAETISRLKQAGYSWQQVAFFLETSTGRKFHRNTLLTWWHRQALAQSGTNSGGTSAATHQMAAKQVATASENTLGALDSLLDECQQDLPGLPRNRVRG